MIKKELCITEIVKGDIILFADKLSINTMSKSRLP
jgi:hypothetical protein